VRSGQGISARRGSCQRWAAQLVRMNVDVIFASSSTFVETAEERKRRAPPKNQGKAAVGADVAQDLNI
jgi:hypothetical protein